MSCRFGLSPSRISVSTVGVVPRIRQLMEDLPQVSLALSLHAPNQAVRLKIVPSAVKWDIDELLAVSDEFVCCQNEMISLGSGSRPRKNLVHDSENIPPHSVKSNREQNRRRRLLLEYVLLGPDINCLPVHAHELGQLLSANPQRLGHTLLNVIPYNPTDAGKPFGYQSPGQSVINEFVGIVREYGVLVMVRQELGQDVNAACGQLVVQSTKKKSINSSDTEKCVDIEDTFGTTGRSNKRLQFRKKRTAHSVSTNEPFISNQRHFSRLRSLIILLILIIILRVAAKFVVWL